MGEASSKVGLKITKDESVYPWNGQVPEKR